MKNKILKLTIGIFALTILVINVLPAFASSNLCREGCPQCAAFYVMNSANCPDGESVYFRCEYTADGSDHCCVTDQTLCDSPN